MATAKSTRAGTDLALPRISAVPRDNTKYTRMGSSAIKLPLSFLLIYKSSKKYILLSLAIIVRDLLSDSSLIYYSANYNIPIRSELILI
jgi:hypothetical protein